MFEGMESIMQLYTASDCLKCHQVRYLLAEKGINVTIIEVDDNPKAQEDLAQLTPYGDTPTLVDRDILLYGYNVIFNYVDERYPHPPLMPIDPISRARLRLVHYRIERDWFSLADDLRMAKQRRNTKGVNKLTKDLQEAIIASDELFGMARYLLNEDLSLVDCMLVPFLWRLPSLGVEYTKQARHLNDYAQRMFNRKAFRKSLTSAEKTLLAA